MAILAAFCRKTLDTLGIYWELVRVIVPVAVVTQLLQELGVIRAVAPLFAPLMSAVGLPPELAFAWLTGLLVGIWGAIMIVFALVPVSSLSTADMTILSALLLFAHAIPIEQQIIRKAGPGFLVTAVLRIGGGFLFAALLHQLFTDTGWLADPVSPSWTPMGTSTDWTSFFIETVKTLAMMLVVLLALSWAIELLRISGILDQLNLCLAPLFRLAGIDKPTVPFAAIGLLLGISYGGGLLIREARHGEIPPRQIFLACVFMGFAHSIIEDTLLVTSLGADFTSLFLGRLIFAVLATAAIAAVMRSVPDAPFFRIFFRPLHRQHAA